MVAANAGSIVKFDDVIEQVKVTADALGETIEQNLPEYAPSIIGRAASSVTLQVTKGDQRWSRSLERLVREHIESFDDGITGARCTLTVVYVK